MATEALISWKAPAHFHIEKGQDWYWIVGIITLAIAAVCFIFGLVIPGLFVIVAATTLVLHASKPAPIVDCEVNDRGVIVGNTLYPFLSLESFHIPHDGFPPKLIIKSHRLLMPLIVILIDEVDPEKVREIMLHYIAETELHEPMLQHLFEMVGF